MGFWNIFYARFLSSDGGRFNDPDRAYARALETGKNTAPTSSTSEAESTRTGIAPDYKAIEEWQRLSFPS